MQTKQTRRAGFTLVELAIVLVIIGLIVGGVLVGQDLIKAAEINATVSQLEKYNAAVNTFRGKYNALPGDINNPAQFGLASTNSGATNRGDGDGQLESGSCSNAYGIGGENAIFWNHLSTTNMIADGVTGVSDYSAVAALTINDTHLPAARLGLGNRIHVFSNAGRNFFGVGSITATTITTCAITSTSALSPQAAFQIDNKMDDGNAANGVVISVADFVTPTAAGGGAPGGTMTSSACYANAAGTTSGTTYTNGQYNTAPDANATSLNCRLRIRTSF